MNGVDYTLARRRMVREQLVARGIKDKRILAAMLALPRHLFVDPSCGPQAYSDYPFPIGYSQTMSQPFMVAFLAEQLQLEGREKVLEIGTGSGYQAAVLSYLCGQVFTVERIGPLARKARAVLASLEIGNVEVRIGDGALGWPQHVPFDRILLTAAAETIPRRLLSQLAPSGFMLAPVVKKEGKQELLRIEKGVCGPVAERIRDCSFVPLVVGRELEV